MSLLDLLLAKALVDTLARAANMPENFKQLRPIPASWRGLRDICKEGNNVIAVEVTRSDNQACRRAQQTFLQLARKHDELTFIRAEIDESNYTFPEVYPRASMLHDFLIKIKHIQAYIIIIVSACMHAVLYIIVYIYNYTSA